MYEFPESLGTKTSEVLWLDLVSLLKERSFKTSLPSSFLKTLLQYPRIPSGRRGQGYASLYSLDSPLSLDGLPIQSVRIEPKLAKAEGGKDGKQSVP